MDALLGVGIWAVWACGLRGLLVEGLVGCWAYGLHGWGMLELDSLVRSPFSFVKISRPRY
jgi:hypothetical protein